QAGMAPQPHGHHVVDVDRKRAVDLGRLRQVGDVLRAQAATLDAAGERLEHTDDALEQRRLAGPIRADHRDQRSGLDRAIEMVHGRMPLVAERNVAELQRRGHRLTPSSPRARCPTAPRSMPPRPPGAPPPTCAGSTARSTPEDAPRQEGGGGAGGLGWAWRLRRKSRKCYNVT